MSSPSVAGAVALLISGLKQEGIPYTPASIKRAIQNTARPVTGIEVFALGAGLLQVDKAFEHCCKYGPELASRNLRFEVDLPHSRGGLRGVYLRNAEDCTRITEPTVRVRAIFHEEAAHEHRIGFECRLNLHTTVPWIQAPKHLLLHHGERNFNIRVDPTALTLGEVHYGEVVAYDSNTPAAGPLFSLPVTVIRPEILEDKTEQDNNTCWRRTYPKVAYRPGLIVRRFVSPPLGATHAIFTIRGCNIDAPRRFVLHAVQLVPQKMTTPTELEKYLWVAEGSETKVPMKVVGGLTVEVCLAQFWSSIGTAEVLLQVW